MDTSLPSLTTWSFLQTTGALCSAPGPQARLGLARALTCSKVYLLLTNCHFFIIIIFARNNHINICPAHISFSKYLSQAFNKGFSIFLHVFCCCFFWGVGGIGNNLTDSGKGEVSIFSNNIGEGGEGYSCLTITFIPNHANSVLHYI